MSSIVAYTDIESKIEPNIVIGGINSKAQNCEACRRYLNRC